MDTPKHQTPPLLPPPLPPRRTIVQDQVPLDQNFASEQSQEDREVPEPETEIHLSDQQLQDLYDDEEIDRFLKLFSACVTEIRLPDTPTSDTLRATISSVNNPNEQLTEEQGSLDDAGNGVAVNLPPDMGPSDQVSSSASPSHDSFCATIAFRYLVPNLPPPPMPAPAFTLGRLRVATQRLYLSVQPAYKYFFLDLAKLATWQEPRRSFKFCVLFWILWYQNLLLPALFFRILFALVHVRFFPRPALSELRERRQEIKRANEFGEEIQEQLSSTSVLGIKEIWGVFTLINKARAKITPKEQTKSKEDDSTVLDNTRESKEEMDTKRAILRAINEVADFHERIKNIFLWRRPGSSRQYGVVMAFLLLVTLITPAQYLAKFVYFIGGLIFWHIIPLLAALPASDRARLPLPFLDVPTDADYAMELISKRIAAGLHVTPAKSGKSRNAESGPPLNETDIAKRDDFSPGESEHKSINWKRWGERAAIGKAWVGDGKRLMTGSYGLPQERPESSVETHTFPATYNTLPGLITVTAATFLFTPLMTTNAKVIIPLGDLRGVKKVGIIKGLSLRWTGSDLAGGKIEKEEKFTWVGGRDELFARLLGVDGRRWLRA